MPPTQVHAGPALPATRPPLFHCLHLGVPTLGHQPNPQVVRWGNPDKVWAQSSAGTSAARSLCHGEQGPCRPTPPEAQPPGPYGFMLKKSLMPSEETGLGPLFFSATDLSLVQVRCTFSGSPSPSPSGSSPGDGELLGQLGALWSWISCT